MKKESKKDLYAGLCALALFILWTVLVRIIDVKPIGPKESAVGFAALNGAFHSLTGVHMPLYVITDWLGLVPFGFAAGFAVLGLVQWIKRKKLSDVDRSLYVLGAFYAVTVAAYLLFETVVVNYRPVLIDGRLEASYPSSTTMLVSCVMPTAIMQFNDRIKNKFLRQCFAVIITAFTVFMVVGRLFSGVHWLSDIIGGALLAIGLVMTYRYVVRMK